MKQMTRLDPIQNNSAIGHGRQRYTSQTRASYRSSYCISLVNASRPDDMDTWNYTTSFTNLVKIKADTQSGRHSWKESAFAPPSPTATYPTRT